MSREITNYDIIDTFDQNKFQTVLMGIDNNNYQDIVIINKLYKSDSVNQLFIDKYKKFSENIVSVTDSDNEFIVINQYEQASLISDYLNEQSLDLNERIRLGKSFLYQISDFENLELPLQLVFIQADQLTIKNGVLKFSNYILLKDYHTETTQLDILREIGKTLEVILQLHREKLTSDLSSLQQFIYKLLKTNEIPNSYNDLYNNFKVIAANLQEDEIMYTPLFSEDNPVQSNHEDPNQMRMPKETEALISHIPNAEIEDIKITYDSIEDSSNDDLLDVINNLEEDEIFLIEDEIDLIEEASDENIETIKYDYHELGDEGDLIIESLDESDELVEDIIPSDETIDHAIDQLLKFTEPVNSVENDETNSTTEKIDRFKQILSEIQDVDVVDSDDAIKQSNMSFEEVEIINKPIEKNMDDEIKIIYEPIEEISKEEAETANEPLVEILDKEPDATFDILEDQINIESEPIEELSKDEVETVNEPMVEILNKEPDASFDIIEDENDITSEPIEDIIELVLEQIDVDDINTISEDDSIFSEDVVDEIIEMDNKKYYHDEKHHSVVLTNETSDPIQEILDRNDKQYSDLYVSEKKTKKRFLPTFLLFFIVLIVITSLLIYYTNSYM